METGEKVLIIAVAAAVVATIALSTVHYFTSKKTNISEPETTTLKE